MSDAAYQIDLASVKPVTASLKAVHLEEAPEDLFQMIMNAKQNMLEQRYAAPPDTSKNPTYAPYATVVVNGKVVAKIDNHGFVETSNAMSDQCADAIKAADDRCGGASGPQLAQARAEEIAKALGGKVDKASTAMTQRAFEATPQPKATVNEAAMRADPEYAQIAQLRQAHAAFLAQHMDEQQATA
ncbi:MAG: hypothetical protein B193_2599 [Solidesulfovibrio magneticus str. Maddingley MBC34]|uniref:Uncharacterized protein n=1 Tax=Solidesulfovibrio magneticus str. Maddingley MBC34 TaxID=1206767 RepID=K6FJE3_9BACT|nr:MAG: hypothetical protein B193_2599 [Solidesulfovibrio magneticus str. Maddingley MBC34]